MPLDADTERSILIALGRPSAWATHLGEGFASDAWLVRDGDARLVLRIQRPDAGYPDSYQIEHERMAPISNETLAGLSGQVAAFRRVLHAAPVSGDLRTAWDASRLLPSGRWRSWASRSARSCTTTWPGVATAASRSSTAHPGG